MSAGIQAFAEKSLAKELKGRIHMPGPPLDRRRSGTHSTKAASLTVELPESLLKDLSTLTKGELFLQYAAIMSAVNVCLYRYAGFSPSTIGCPRMTSENGSADSDKVALVAVDVHDQLSFRELLLDVRQSILDAYAQQGNRLSRLKEFKQNEGAANRGSLFDVAVQVIGLHQPMPEWHHDITLIFSPQSEPASLGAVYSQELYNPQTVQRFCQHILRILQSGLANTNQSIGDLEIVTDEEHTQISAWNDTAVEYPKDKCVYQLFEEHAAKTPEKTALVFGAQRLTYRELNERANQVAHYLQRLHIVPDTPIGLFLNRSIEQVIALLGILKAGGAYVPYDAAYPKERLAVMFEDLKVKAILTSEGLLERLPSLRTKILCVDRDAEAIASENTTNPETSPAPSNLCYVIFTSGSTGRPKATAVHHQGWTNLLNWFVKEFGVSPADKTLVISSISFDITQRAMAMPLTSGGELHLVTSDFYNPDLILSTIEAEQITLLNSAPSTFYPLVEAAQTVSNKTLRSLRVLFLGGEAISASRLKGWALSADCRTRIANVYGAAECSDVSTFYRLHDFDRYIESSVPIGKPTYNNQAYVLDKNLRPVPIGVTGEICLGGDGVGKGYVTDRFMTSEKFRQNPFAKTAGERLYRTGDLGRYLPDGNLEFCGRVDHQVKVRGQRIELGEIETVLRQQPNVKEAVVVQTYRTPSDQRLIAYCVPREQSYTGQRDDLIVELRRRLAMKLPQYMIPNDFVLLEEIPLSPNGKIDREALPLPEVVSASDVLPMHFTPTEAKLAALCEKLLGKGNIAVDSNFFDLGGHSLLVTQLLAQISDSFKIQLPPPELYREPTVAGIARRIDAMVTVTKEQSLV